MLLVLSGRGLILIDGWQVVQAAWKNGSWRSSGWLFLRSWRSSGRLWFLQDEFHGALWFLLLVWLIGFLGFLIGFLILFLLHGLCRLFPCVLSLFSFSLRFPLQCLIFLKIKSNVSDNVYCLHSLKGLRVILIFFDISSFIIFYKIVLKTVYALEMWVE